ncbi:MAG: exodeoxyribonuclease VII small subunit [Actinomycetota bacterium]|jgi:exodeoxyribonuclease VII small subunit
MTDSNSTNAGTNAAIDSLGYAAALSELETILSELERDNVDVDRLASQVQRASELIRLCRERIGNAKLQIEHVVAELGA